MKAMAFEVSWSTKTIDAARTKLQDGSGKETFAQSLKQSGLGDLEQAHIKTAKTIMRVPVIQGDLNTETTDQATVPMQKTKVSGKDTVSGLDSAEKAPDTEESSGPQRVVQGEVKFSAIPDAASREWAGKEIAVTSASGPMAARKETSTAKLKKHEANKDGKGVITDATKIGDPGSVQIVAPAALHFCVNDVGLQSSAICGGVLEDGRSGRRQVGPSGGQVAMNATQRATKGAEIGKNGSPKIAGENSLGADAKNSSAKDITDAGLQKNSGESTTNREIALGKTTSAAKIEAEASVVMPTAIQHVAAGVTSQDNAGTPRHVNMVQSTNHEAGQAREPRTTSLLTSHDAGYRDNYGSALESGLSLLATTSKTLEIGMASGTHGWLKIRAEIEDGIVTASLSARSTTTQEMLHHELPSLTAFLQEEKIGVSSVLVRQTSPAGTEGMSYGSEMQHRGRSSQQDSGGRGDDTPVGSDERIWGSGDQVTMHEMWRGLSNGAAFLPAITTVGSGGWLNVRV